MQSQKGYFEIADGGTIFFDEIGNIGPETQAKLLRVIQEREFMPLGSTETDEGGRPHHRRHQRRPAQAGRRKAASAKISTTG